MKVTGDQIIQALRDTDPAVRLDQLYERFIKGEFLESVATDLDLPVTIDNLLSVKTRYIRGWMNLRASSESDRSEQETRKFAERGEAAVEEYRALMTTLASAFRAKGGSERMILEMMGLCPENLAKADAGSLTIGELLATQPSLILEGAM